jgi:hypothetical protein
MENLKLNVKKFKNKLILLKTKQDIFKYKNLSSNFKQTFLNNINKKITFFSY